VKTWLIDACERAVRTFAGALLAYFGAGTFSLLHANWAGALDVAGGAALASLLMSAVALYPVGAPGTASFTKAVVPAGTPQPASELYGRHADNTPEQPAVTDEPQRTIPEQVIPGKRLGRHVNHDPRSLSYLMPPGATPATAMWTRRVPVFDQGDLGSCTGNAAAGVLGTDPFYAKLPSGLVDDENEAVTLYGAATSLDSYPGSYPPDDTGSDGLSVAKACQKAGLISGYQHITSVAAAQTAIQSGPFIVGVNWYASMDTPDANGLVTVSGSIRGGHEFECHGYDAAADLWWFTNSWGPSWGKDGTFCMSSASFTRLLSEQGDATVFLPVTPSPAPQPPAPVPPGPAPIPVPPTPGPVTPPQPQPTGFPLAAYDAWHLHPRSETKMHAFLKACDAWLGQ
jgi:hypothetical protein